MMLTVMVLPNYIHIHRLLFNCECVRCRYARVHATLFPVRCPFWQGVRPLRTQNHFRLAYIQMPCAV